MSGPEYLYKYDNDFTDPLELQATTNFYLLFAVSFHYKYGKTNL